MNDQITETKTEDGGDRIKDETAPQTEQQNDPFGLLKNRKVAPVDTADGEISNVRPGDANSKTMTFSEAADFDRNKSNKG